MQHDESSNRWRDWLSRNAEKYLLYARQQTRCNADAEDVLQEALVESWKRCDGCEPADALVFATIRRRAIDLSRANDRRGRREQTDQPAEQWFAPDVAEWDTQRALEQAVKNLPPMHAEAVTLKIWGGLSFKEIAETTGVPLNTAASRYRYGIEALRETLKEALS